MRRALCDDDDDGDADGDDGDDGDDDGGDEDDGDNDDERKILKTDLEKTHGRDLVPEMIRQKAVVTAVKRRSLLRQR